MATSGNFSGGGGYQGRTLQMLWYRTGYSIDGCYSDCHWDLAVIGGSSSYYYHYHEELYINGSAVYNNGSRTKRYKGTIASGTFRVNHNTSTGAGSFTSRIRGAMYTSSYNVDTTQTFNLDTIPRQANITECPNSLTDEGTPYLKFSNPGNFNMQCWLEVNPNSDHLAQRTIPTAKSGTYTWELTSSERTQLRQALGDSKSGKIRIGLYSNNGQWASYKDIPFSIVNDAPTLGTCSYSATNHTDLAYTSTIIKGYSNVNVTVGQATAKKDATIKSYKVVIGSQVKTNTTYGTFSFSNVDSDTIEIYVEDNRGNVATTVLKATTFIEYVEPYLEKPMFHRGDEGIGTDVELTIKGTMWTGGFGKLSNAITSVVYYYKEQGASTWIQGATAISITAASSFEKTIAIRGDLGANGFDAGKNYDIKVIITDRLSQKESVGLLLTGKPLVAYHQNGVSFGAFYSKEEGGPFQVNGINIINLIFPVGSQIYNGDDSFNPNDYYPGTTWIRIEDDVLAGRNVTDESSPFYQETGTEIGENSGTHYHIQSVSFDGSKVYVTNCNNMPSSRVVTTSRAVVTADNIGTGATRQDTTFNASISKIQKSRITNIWQRTA